MLEIVALKTSYDRVITNTREQGSLSAPAASHLAKHQNLYAAAPIQFPQCLPSFTFAFAPGLHTFSVPGI